MARLITKFKYLKPDERNHFGGYAEYIATREGAEKIDESRKFAPATDKQRRLIQKILADFPDSRSSLEYEDYLKDKTIVTASEFITRMLEENADEMMHTTTYADYIATRPRAERFGSHGLFTDDGVAVDMKKVSDELNSNIDTVCLCMDNDTAGQAANKRISDKLFIQGIKHEILVPEFKDWNEDLLCDEQEEVECQTLQL